MTQPDLNFDTSLPIAPSIYPQARHASSTGAVAAARHYGQKVLLYLQLLREAGSRGLSDHEAAALMGQHARPVAGVGSICSIRDACGDLVVPSGEWELKTWPSGLVTRRVRWMRAAKREQSRETSP